jgi:hypothetical protein
VAETDARRNQGDPERPRSDVVADLRSILLTDPARFEREVDGLIRASTDPVTRQFWQNVKDLARKGSK